MSEIKFNVELEINENQWAKNLFGLSHKECFVIAYGTFLVESQINQAYNTNSISKDEQKKFLDDIRSLRQKILKGIEEMKNEKRFGDTNE